MIIHLFIYSLTPPLDYFIGPAAHLPPPPPPLLTTNRYLSIFDYTIVSHTAWTVMSSALSTSTLRMTSRAPRLAVRGVRWSSTGEPIVRRVFLDSTFSLSERLVYAFFPQPHLPFKYKNTPAFRVKLASFLSVGFFLPFVASWWQLYV